MLCYSFSITDNLPFLKFASLYRWSVKLAVQFLLLFYLQITTTSYFKLKVTFA